VRYQALLDFGAQHPIGTGPLAQQSSDNVLVYVSIGFGECRATILPARRCRRRNKHPP
jgi:hypothetical protein